MLSSAFVDDVVIAMLSVNKGSRVSEDGLEICMTEKSVEEDVRKSCDEVSAQLVCAIANKLETWKYGAVMIRYYSRFMRKVWFHSLC